MCAGRARLIADTPSDLPLRLRVARGVPNIMADHEQQLQELCLNAVETNAQVDECIASFMEGTYFTGEEDGNSAVYTNNGFSQNKIDSDDDKDMLDNLQMMWASELADSITSTKPPPSGKRSDAAASPSAQVVKPKPKPWSVRSSPSGTWVRDPVTRQMKNLDA
jgi:hypothetical protein